MWCFVCCGCCIDLMIVFNFLKAKNDQLEGLIFIIHYNAYNYITFKKGYNGIIFHYESYKNKNDVSSIEVWSDKVL